MMIPNTELVPTVHVRVRETGHECDIRKVDYRGNEKLYDLIGDDDAQPTLLTPPTRPTARPPRVPRARA